MDNSVADKSGDLQTYMSNRSDDLVALAKYYGKVEGVMVSAELTNVNAKVSTHVLFLGARVFDTSSAQS